MRTDRLVIEPLSLAHADLVFEDLLDDRLYAYIPDRIPASVEALRTRYSKLIAGPPSGSGERWLNWIMRDAADKTPIGSLQATIFEDRGRPSYVAYVVFPRHWRCGYATEGTRWLLGHLERHEDVRTVEAWIDVRNESSKRVVRRLGFEHREVVSSPDGSCDDVFMKRLATAADTALASTRTASTR